MDYDPDRYWGDLHDRRFDERTVGYPNLAASLNAGMYRSLLSSVTRAVAQTGLSAQGGQVLDVGAGTGVWVDFWERRGAVRLAGADIAQSSVDNLQARWPSHRFLCVDVGDEDPGLPGDNDIVSAMSILLHIVDDERFARAIANLAGALRPGGALITIDPAVVHQWWGPPFGAQASSKARPVEEYRVAFAAAGLELTHVLPATVLLSNAIDTRREKTFRAFSIYWSLLTKIVGSDERRGRIAASLLAPLDQLAVRLARTGPSAKILIARRTEP